MVLPCLRARGLLFSPRSFPTSRFAPLPARHFRSVQFVLRLILRRLPAFSSRLFRFTSLTRASARSIPIPTLFCAISPSFSPHRFCVPFRRAFSSRLYLRSPVLLFSYVLLKCTLGAPNPLLLTFTEYCNSVIIFMFLGGLIKYCSFQFGMTLIPCVFLDDT